MTFKEIKNEIDMKLKDEGSDTDKYDILAKDIMQVEEVEQGVKESIAAIFYKIATDEKSHHTLLETIAEVLKQY